MTSPRNAPAAIAVNTGERLTSSAAVPAGTVSSPPLSSSWYAVMPASAMPVSAGRSRRAGSRTPRSAPTTASATAATSSRSTLRWAAPKCGSAARIAANAEPQSTIVVARAAAARSGMP